MTTSLPLPVDEHGAHIYLSTACVHEAMTDDPARAADLHAYCAGDRKLDGQAKDGGPGRCKWCPVACACPQHVHDPNGPSQVDTTNSVDVIDSGPVVP